MTKPAHHNLCVTASLAVTLFAFQPAYATEQSAKDATQDTELQTLLTEQCAGKKGLFKMKCEGEVKTAFYRVKNAQGLSDIDNLKKKNAQGLSDIDNLKKKNAQGLLDIDNLKKKNAELDKQNAQGLSDIDNLKKKNAELDKQNEQKWREISDKVEKKIK